MSENTAKHTSVQDWHPRGKSIRENIGHGQTRTIARFDTRGLFCEGYDEGNAAYAVECCQVVESVGLITAKAARELLTALVRLATASDVVTGTSHDVEMTDWAEFSNASEAARTAIAKATGE